MEIFRSTSYNHPKNDVIFGSEKSRIPKIRYVFNKEEHTYYPDLFLISYNLIVEVKSDWLYNGKGQQEEKYIKEKVHAKLDAMFEAGYNTLLVVYNDKNLVHYQYKDHNNNIVMYPDSKS